MFSYTYTDPEKGINVNLTFTENDLRFIATERTTSILRKVESNEEAEKALMLFCKVTSEEKVAA